MYLLKSFLYFPFVISSVEFKLSKFFLDKCLPIFLLIFVILIFLILEFLLNLSVYKHNLRRMFNKLKPRWCSGKYACQCR